LKPFVLKRRMGALYEKFPFLRGDGPGKMIRIKRGLTHHRQNSTTSRVHSNEGSGLMLKSFLGHLLNIEVNGEAEVIPRKRLHAPKWFDLPSQSIDFNLSTSIHSSEIRLPTVFNAVLSDHGTHSIKSCSRLFQFIFINLSEVTNEMRSQRSEMISSPRPDIHKEAREVNSICFENGDLIFTGLKGARFF
jgi:hypothetical protein